MVSISNKFADNSFMGLSIDTNFDPPQFTLDSVTFSHHRIFAHFFEVGDFYPAKKTSGIRVHWLPPSLWSEEKLLKERLNSWYMSRFL